MGLIVFFRQDINFSTQSVIGDDNGRHHRRIRNDKRCDLASLLLRDEIFPRSQAFTASRKPHPSPSCAIKQFHKISFTFIVSHDFLILVQAFFDPSSLSTITKHPSPNKAKPDAGAAVGWDHFRDGTRLFANDFPTKKE